MAPPRTKKGKRSTNSESSTRHQAATARSPASTPQRSPQKHVMRITEAQKQALIDNLQLEVTERARKLRAQYSLQAQSLRTRIELRINRIPTALRKSNMGELLAKYEDMREQQQKAKSIEEQRAATSDQALSEVQPAEESKPSKAAANAKSGGTKRNSDDMESAPKDTITIHEDPIANPKKRTKASSNLDKRRAPNPSTVLSPKSANSRTLPQSPIRPALGSPMKSFTSHPASPLKAMASPAKAAMAPLASQVTEKARPGRPKSAASKTAASKAAAGRKKREAENALEQEGLRTVSSTSNSSAVSTGTTIVKNMKKKQTAGPAKKGVGVKAVGKKVAGAADPAPAGRRVLRKR